MSLCIKHRVTLDLSHTGKQVTIPFRKNDVGAHEIVFSLRLGSSPVELPVGTVAAIFIHNGAGDTGVADPCIVNHVDGTVIYTPTPDALSVAGNIACDMRIMGEGGASLGTAKFIFAIDDTGMDETEGEVDKALRANGDTWNLIQQTKVNAESAAASAEIAKEKSELAERAAGKAELGASMADLSLVAAEAKAGEAASSADAAAASEQAARRSESTAKGRAEVASKKAEEAATSASEAAESAAEAADVVTSTVDKMNSIEKIAKGATQALSFTNYKVMIGKLLGDLAPTYTDVSNGDSYNITNALNIGKSLLIGTKTVPDLWIADIALTPAEASLGLKKYTSDEEIVEGLRLFGEIQVGAYTLFPLETQKVDLSSYYKKDDIDAMFGIYITEVDELIGGGL